MEHWDDLRSFLAVARLGTLTAAAGELGVNVSTLHRRLAAFEAGLETALFDKGPRGYRLTNAGEALLPRAEEVEEAVFAASRAVVGHDQTASGEVRITLPLALLGPVARHLAAFTQACRGVRPIVRADDSAIDLERDTDLALRATTRPPDDAVGRDLCGLAWGHYAPAGLAPGEAAARPWIHYVGMDASPGAVWRRAHHGSTRPILSVTGVVAMHATLAPSGAQGVLPCFLGDADTALQRLGDPIASSRLWLLVHADLRRSARVRAVIDFLVPRLLADRARFEAS